MGIRAVREPPLHKIEILMPKVLTSHIQDGFSRMDIQVFYLFSCSGF
jgi:hypothetical protein